MIRMEEYYRLRKEKTKRLGISLSSVTGLALILFCMFYFPLNEYLNFWTAWLLIFSVGGLVISGIFFAIKHDEIKREYDSHIENGYTKQILKEYNSSGLYDYTARKVKPENYIKDIYHDFRYMVDDFTGLPFYGDENPLNDRRRLRDFIRDIKIAAKAVDFPDTLEIKTIEENRYSCVVRTGNVQVMVIAHTVAFAGSMAILKALQHEQEYNDLPSLYRLTNREWTEEYKKDHPKLNKDDKFIEDEYRKTLLWHPDSEINQILATFLD